MRDITYKQKTLRTALASGFVHCSMDSLNKIKNKEVPKGDIFQIAQCAAMLGAKQTQFLIPHCHPVLIDGLDVSFEIVESIDKKGILITTTAKSIGRTGIEMEALTATSVAALTIYDVLKYFKDPNLEISEIKLLEKKGGKTDKLKHEINGLEIALLISSSDILKETKANKISHPLQNFLESKKCLVVSNKVIGSDKETIQKEIKSITKNKTPFLFIAGGTGIGHKDHTYEAISEILDYEIEGISDAIRNYSFDRTPISFLSRLISGMIDDTVVISIPGSSNGAMEAMHAIVPAVFKANWMKKS